MNHYAGIDVSLEYSSVCVVDANGKIVCEGKVASEPEALTVVVYGSIFAALLPSVPPWWMLIALPPLIFLVETVWYGVVALAFSADRPRAAYLRSKRWIDRTAGLVRGGLGLRLILETARSR